MKGSILTATIMTMYSPFCNISSIVWTGWDVAARVLKISQNVMSIRMPRATVGRHLGMFIFTVRFVFKCQISQYLEQNISVPVLPRNQTFETLCLHIWTENKTFISLVGHNASAVVQTGSQPDWRVRCSPWHYSNSLSFADNTTFIPRITVLPEACSRPSS